MILFDMDQIKAGLDKILSNEITAFAFVLSCAIGAFAAIAGGYYTVYQLAVMIGAY